MCSGADANPRTSGVTHISRRHGPRFRALDLHARVLGRRPPAPLRAHRAVLADMVKIRMQLQYRQGGQQRGLVRGFARKTLRWCFPFAMATAPVMHAAAPPAATFCCPARPRLQLQTGTMVVREEGVMALWKGLGPAVARGLVYGGGGTAALPGQQLPSLLLCLLCVPPHSPCRACRS